MNGVFCRGVFCVARGCVGVRELKAHFTPCQNHAERGRRDTHVHGVGAGWTAAGGGRRRQLANFCAALDSDSLPCPPSTCWVVKGSNTEFFILVLPAATCRRATGCLGKRRTSAAKLISAGGDELCCLREESRGRRSGLPRRRGPLAVVHASCGRRSCTPVAE